MVTIQKVENPNESPVNEAVQLICDLISTDPGMRAFTAGDPALVSLMARAQVASMARLGGHMFTATDEDGVLVGFVLCLPDGEDAFVTEEQRQMGFYKFMDKLSDQGKEYYKNNIGIELPAFLDKAIGIPSAGLNTYWCNYVMVRSDYQGKGIGRALLDLAFQEAKKRDVVLALGATNPQNVVVYQKLGFELKGHATFTSPWGDWPIWVFAKETRIK